MDGARMSAEPPQESRVEALERENRALRRANAKLMRERLGSSNTAAAGKLGRSAGDRSAARSAIRAPFARARLAVRRALLRVLR
jgi:hypothetical protein